MRLRGTPDPQRDLFWARVVYSDTAVVRLPAGGEQSEIASLVDDGHLRVSGISSKWNLSPDRVRQIVNRDAFPPAKKVGIRTSWLLEDLEEWWFRDGRHAW